MLRSLILPGWGHFYSSDDTKGYILSSLSAVTLGVMIYSIFDTQTKENEYLAETTPLLIQEKYGQYNSSYKTRNILIASYALLWMYSQIDLLYFSANNSSLRISVSFEEKNIPSLSSRLKFAFPISR